MQHLPEYEWHYGTLPGRHFSWRIRGNPLSWRWGEQAHLFSQPFDLVIATSMVDVATLRGLSPSLRQTPWLLYFHENQFAYPKSQQQHASIEPQMVNLYSALAADKVVFNSQFNQETFLAGVQNLMSKMPDQTPKDIARVIESKSQVLPVPITSTASSEICKPQGHPLKLIWNHRWEYDKGPERLLHILTAIDEQKLPITVDIAGKRFKREPDLFRRIAKLKCVQHADTYETREEYLQALSQSHIVLSTAHHEFQGLAMLEGAASGCVPLAPNDLAYPEWIPQDYLYNSTESAVKRLVTWCDRGLPEKIDVHHYSWQELTNDYRALLQSLSGLA